MIPFVLPRLPPEEFAANDYVPINGIKPLSYGFFGEPADDDDGGDDHVYDQVSSELEVMMIIVRREDCFFF